MQKTYFLGNINIETYTQALPYFTKKNSIFIKYTARWKIAVVFENFIRVDTSEKSNNQYLGSRLKMFNILSFKHIINFWQQLYFLLKEAFRVNSKICALDTRPDIQNYIDLTFNIFFYKANLSNKFFSDDVLKKHLTYSKNVRPDIVLVFSIKDNIHLIKECLLKSNCVVCLSNNLEYQEFKNLYKILSGNFFLKNIYNNLYLYNYYFCRLNANTELNYYLNDELASHYSSEAKLKLFSKLWE